MEKKKLWEATAPGAKQRLVSMMPQRQHEAKSSEEIVEEICRDDLSEEESKRGVLVLIWRHPEDFRLGLRRVTDGGGLWARASENLGYNTSESLALRAAEYLLTVPRKGEHKGKRRICTFLEDDSPFGEWMSSKLFGLVREIRKEIGEEIKRMRERKELQEYPESAKDRSEVSDEEWEEAVLASDEEWDEAVLASDEEWDEAVLASDEEWDETGLDDHHSDLASLADAILFGLDGTCRSTLEALFFSDDSEVWKKAQEKSPGIEDCLLRCGEIISQEDVDLTRLVDHPGKAKLWNCAQELSGLCQSLVLRRFFQGLEYWRLGHSLSDNEQEEYESRKKYKRAENDWARYRVKNKCEEKVKQQCSEKAVSYMKEAG